MYPTFGWSAVLRAIMDIRARPISFSERLLKGQAPIAESSPASENFSSKAPSAERLPLSGAETVFGQVFGRGGMSNFQNPKVPLPGGRIFRTHLAFHSPRLRPLVRLLCAQRQELGRLPQTV